VLREAVERHQHDIFVGRLPELLDNERRQLRHGAMAVAAAPDQRSRLVQVRRDITIEVVHEQLAVQLLDSLMPET
jgi:hypothetical protein